MAGANLKLLSPKAIVKYSSFFVESLPAIQLKAVELIELVPTKIIYNKTSKPTRLNSFDVRILAVGLSSQSHLGLLDRLNFV